jgi:hypothetical protein
LFVGRLLPHKGVDDLIRGLPENLRLTIVGPAPHEETKARLEALARGKAVTFLHDVNDEALVQQYRRTSCIVLPSVYRTPDGTETRVPEPLGQTLLEGMACGAPAICTRVASMPEVVEDGVTGFVVPPTTRLRSAIGWHGCTHIFRKRGPWAARDDSVFSAISPGPASSIAASRFTARPLRMGTSGRVSRCSGKVEDSDVLERVIGVSRPFLFKGKGFLLDPVTPREGVRQVPVAGGYSMTLDLANVIHRQIFMGCFARDMTRWARTLLPAGGTFLDIGAHAGYFSLTAADRVGPTGRVYAIEPNPGRLRRCTPT